MTEVRCNVAFAFAAVLIASSACAPRDQDATLTSSTSGATPKVRYAYDPLGRLVQAATSDGTGVQYSYDAVGNITSIRRLASGTLNIIDFVPPGGGIGSTVAVYGGGFSATASEDVVAFNGTAATITSATPTALTVRVPAGATTGKITVTTSQGSATSSADYMVLSSSVAPGIASFAPAFGTQGAVISVTGVNFQTNVVDNNVSVGGHLARVVKDASSPTGTLVKFTVPSSSASGRIEVTTPFGSALSSDEFFAVPAGVAPADLEVGGRVTVGGPPRALTTTTAGKKLLLVFDAVAGQRLHLIATGGTFATGFSADVYGPTGPKLQMLPMTNNSVGDFTAPVVASGLYTIVVNPSATDKGTVQLGIAADVVGALALDGTTNVSLTRGQNGRFSFAAQANTGYGLAVTGLAFTPSTGSPSLAAVLRKADGTMLVSCSFSVNNSCDFDPASFATTGTYFVDLDPSGLVAASFNLVLSTDVSGTLPVDTLSPTTVTTARSGQNARYSFAGTAGQALTVVLTGNAIDDGNPGTTNSTQVLVFPPNNTVNVVGSGAINTVTAATTLDVLLTQTGTYTLALKPSGLDSGSINVQLKSFATGTMALDNSTPVSLSSGQNGRFSFTAQANTGYGLAIADLSFTPSTGSPSLAASLRKSDGTTLASCPVSTGTSCDFEPTSFATAGTYFVDFDPVGLVGASFTAFLSTDATGTATVDAAPTTVTIARPGQNARYRFAGTAGQLVSVVLNGSTLDDGNSSTMNGTQVLVLRPNGGTIGSGTFNAVAAGLSLDVALTDTGNYMIAIKPSGLDAGTVNLRMRSVATGALTLDGGTTVSLDAGQNGRFSFTAQASTAYGLALANLVLTPSTAIPAPQVTVTLRKADGTSLSTCTFGASGSCDLGAASFATTGSYVLDFDPNGTVATSCNALLSTDLAGTIAVDAAPTVVTFARAGQNARYSFPGTAGQLVKVVISGNTLDDGNAATVNATRIDVFRPTSPNGAPIGTATFNTVSPGTTLNLTLPETGTYAITINPTALDSGSLNLGVTHQ